MGQGHKQRYNRFQIESEPIILRNPHWPQQDPKIECSYGGENRRTKVCHSQAKTKTSTQDSAESFLLQNQQGGERQETQENRQICSESPKEKRGPQSPKEGNPECTTREGYLSNSDPRGPSQTAQDHADCSGEITKKVVDKPTVDYSSILIALTSHQADQDIVLSHHKDNNNLDNFDNILDSNMNTNSNVNSTVTNIAECSEVSKTNHISYLGCKVVNLSDINLTIEQIKVLEKGITFVPTPDKVDLGEIHNDVFSFCRRLHLKLHFYQEDSSIDTSQTQKLPKALYKFKPKNSWVPNTGDPVLRAFCFNVKKDLQELNPKQPDRFNLGKKGIRAISDLKKNPNIVIKKADKGSSVVVMNKSDYIREAERQLSDRNYYIPTEKDLTSEYHEYQVIIYLQTI